MKQKACFLDRDGTLNVEVNYLHEPEKLILEKNVPEALQLLRDNDFKLIVITNQAGVARGMYEEKDIIAVHEKMQELLDPYNVKIDKFYYCMHHPEFTGECKCRKPGTALFLQAAEELNIDLEKSFMIGDRLSDIQAGENAKCRKSFLVMSGYAQKTIDKYPDKKFNIAADILDAACKIINECSVPNIGR